MSLTWISKDESLHHAGRFFHDGDNIPAGILSESRLNQFIAEGKIKNDNVKTVVTDTPEVNKRGRKPKTDEEPEKPVIENDESELS